MEKRVVLIDELAALLRLSKSSIYRMKSRRILPSPISTQGGKLRWLASDIESFIQSQSNTAPPIKVVGASERRRKEKAFKQRQDAASKALEKHRHNRKEKETQS
jgi:predicted DNA-binding transcriptional regulator AlpA